MKLYPFLPYGSVRDAACVEFFDPPGNLDDWQTKQDACAAMGGYLPIPRTTVEVDNTLTALTDLIHGGYVKISLNSNQLNIKN